MLGHVAKLSKKETAFLCEQLQELVSMVHLQQSDGDTLAASPSPDDSLDMALAAQLSYPNWDELQDETVLDMESHDADGWDDKAKDDEVKTPTDFPLDSNMDGEEGESGEEEERVEDEEVKENDTTIDSDVEFVSWTCTCEECTGEVAVGERIPIPNPKVGCQRAVRKVGKVGKPKSKGKAKAKGKAAAKSNARMKRPAASSSPTSRKVGADGGGSDPSEPSGVHRTTLKPPFTMSKRNRTASRPGEAYLQQAAGGP